jgi:hypothetical protein
VSIDLGRRPDAGDPGHGWSTFRPRRLIGMPKGLPLNERLKTTGKANGKQLTLKPSRPKDKKTPTRPTEIS